MEQPTGQALQPLRACDPRGSGQEQIHSLAPALADTSAHIAAVLIES